MAKRSAKNLGGRPPKYENELALRQEVARYFATCENARAMPNKAGLCAFLQISRDTYNEYKKRFPDTLKATELNIENAWVQRLGGNAPTGAIFYLKNAFKDDYREKQEVDHTTAGQPFVLPAEIINKNKLGGSP